MTIAKGHQENRPATRAYRPVATLAIAVLAVLALVVWVMVSQFDAVSRQIQTQSAQQGYINRFSEYAAVVQARVIDDDAVAHLAQRFDPGWVEQHLARNLYARNGIRQFYVLDGQNRPIFAAENGQVVPRANYGGPLAQAATDVLPQLRGIEGTDKAPQLSNIAMVAGRLHMVVVTLVQPETGPSRLGGRAPVVVAALPFDETMLARFGARHLVKDMAINTDFSESTTRARLPLHDVRGQVLAALSWTPRRPGSELFASLQWPLAAMLLILVLLGWSLARQTSRFAKGLILSEARARHLAFHDTLTQLPNRALMFERLNQLRALAHRAPLDVAVHCIDLDRFKEVNDTLGHPAGDALIRAAARRLAGIVRDSDTVARLGGDEFVILQSHTIAPGAAHLAERIINAFARPFDIDGQTVEIGCSIGITLISDPEIPASEVLRQADLALYSSKEKGRNCATFFEPEMDAALRMRRQLETDLREALAEDMLHMVYQPQFDAHGHVVGVEALVRWEHREKGMIPPSTFVLLAEESGLIGQLGDFIMKRVFEETGTICDVPVAINISALQLRMPSFIATVTRLVAENDVCPSNYEFEITETVLLGDDAATRDSIAVLKQEGFSIALDDFGTGYSSLSSLQRFAVDKIKIDRAFVRNLDQSDRDAVTLVDAIIRLARALDLDVIAEGVETQAQRDCLIACGCNRFQGFLFSRPISAADLRALIATDKARRTTPPVIEPRRAKRKVGP
jgi:diguanylate cyclase (GGDEF)-like protein